MLKRLRVIYRKYDGWRGYFYVIRWLTRRYFSKAIGAILKIFLRISFQTAKSPVFFDSLYTGDVDEEVKRISEGERKILGYAVEDEYLQDDPKNLWELNRGHHLVLLSKKRPCSVMSGLDELFVSTNAMEVSIATINRIVAWAPIHSDLGKAEQEAFTDFLKKSLIFMIANNEKSILYSYNHYFFNLIGILWVCESVETTWVINRISGYFKNELTAWLKQTIQKDGSLYEASTHYHKYVLETLLLFLFTFNKSSKYKVCLDFANQMFSFVRKSSYNGKLVPIGDNDSGRILPLPTYFDYDSTDLSLINELASRMRIGMEDSDQNSNEFGLYNLFAGDFNLWVRLEENTKFRYRRIIGSHGHNDQLSFLLYFAGFPIIVDSGVYCYLAKNEMRLKSLLTSSHNTVTVNDWEQGEVYNSFLYRPKRNIGKVFFSHSQSFKGELVVDGKYSHTRKIDVYERLIRLHDEVVASRGDEIFLHYHFHPRAKVELTQSNRLLVRYENLCLEVLTNGGCFSLEEFFYSPEYGTRISSLKAVLKLSCENGKVEVTVVFKALTLTNN